MLSSLVGLTTTLPYAKITMILVTVLSEIVAFTAMIEEIIRLDGRWIRSGRKLRRSDVLSTIIF